MDAQPRDPIVVFGDVIDSRREPVASSAWLRELAKLLAEFYDPDEVLAPIGFTQGDELQCLLAPEADPFLAVLVGTLHEHALPMRWVVAAGPVEGSGPATERSGEAFLRARDLVTAAKARRDRTLAATGEPGAD